MIDFIVQVGKPFSKQSSIRSPIWSKKSASDEFIRVFAAASLKRVCFLSFKENFKKVTKTPPHQLP
jgi:ABC-type molybdate transport system substrate-binding protein